LDVTTGGLQATETTDLNELWEFVPTPSRLLMAVSCVRVDVDAASSLIQGRPRKFHVLAPLFKVLFTCLDCCYWQYAYFSRFYVRFYLFECFTACYECCCCGPASSLADRTYVFGVPPVATRLYKSMSSLHASRGLLLLSVFGIHLCVLFSPFSLQRTSLLLSCYATWSSWMGSPPSATRYVVCGLLGCYELYLAINAFYVFYSKCCCSIFPSMDVAASFLFVCMVLEDVSCMSLLSLLGRWFLAMLDWVRLLTCVEETLTLAIHAFRCLTFGILRCVCVYYSCIYILVYIYMEIWSGPGWPCL
jgi:hypothetical protein